MNQFILEGMVKAHWGLVFRAWLSRVHRSMAEQTECKNHSTCCYAFSKWIQFNILFWEVCTLFYITYVIFRTWHNFFSSKYINLKKNKGNMNLDTRLQLGILMNLLIPKLQNNYMKRAWKKKSCENSFAPRCTYWCTLQRRIDMRVYQNVAQSFRLDLIVLGKFLKTVYPSYLCY